MSSQTKAKSKSAAAESWLVNPETGRMIKRDGPTHTELKSRGILVGKAAKKPSAARKYESPTPGRGKSSPKKASPRKKTAGSHSSKEDPEDEPVGASYFRPSSERSMSDKQKRYCRCVVRVAASKSAVNPYAVCTKSVGRDSLECLAHYNLSAMPVQEVQALARLKKTTVPGLFALQREALQKTKVGFAAHRESEE